MDVGTYMDGRVITHGPGETDFAVGGSPVTFEQLLQYDAFGQVTWASEDIRAWVQELKRWGDWAASSELAAKTEAERALAAQAKAEAKARAKEDRAERAQAMREAIHDMGVQSQWGLPNPSMVCPHCQVKGRVHTKSIKQKRGISGGKATAAVLTGGVSLLATGLARKESVTQAHCDNCHNTWYY